MRERRESARVRDIERETVPESPEALIDKFLGDLNLAA